MSLTAMAASAIFGAYVMLFGSTSPRRIVLKSTRAALLILGFALAWAARADSPTTREGSTAEPRATSAAPAPEGPAQDTAAVQPASADSYLTGNWFGRRPELASKGITFDLSYTADGTKNLRGGLDTAGSTWRRMFEATITLDTKPLLGLEGGSVFLDFQDAQGSNPSDKLVGDAQGIDGLDGVPGTSHQNRTQLAQFWYQQVFSEGTWRVKIGKVDANSEFDRSAFAQQFLNQSTGSSSTLFTLPTYPDGATSINVFAKPSKDLQLGFGVYDGSLAEGVRTGELGPKNFFRRPDDLFLIGEVDKTWTVAPEPLSGRLGIGGWYSTNKFNRLNGGKANGTGGPYALLDQTVWRKNLKDDKDARGVSVFVMYGYADPTILFYDHNFGGGVTWAGAIDGRPNDVLGLGVQSIHFSDSGRSRGYETNYEAFYRIQLRPWLAIQPDLQYVANPGGNHTRDALASTIRFEIHF